MENLAYKIGPLSAREVAEFLGVHINTVKRIPSSNLPYFTVVERGDRRYHLEDVETYVRKRMKR